MCLCRGDPALEAEVVHLRQLIKCLQREKEDCVDEYGLSEHTMVYRGMRVKTCLTSFGGGLLCLLPVSHTGVATLLSTVPWHA